LALYPKAIKRLIPAGPNDPRIEAAGLVFHVAVSEAASLHDWFDGPSNGVEAHFYVRRDGTVEQYRDTAYEADAQGAGNSWGSHLPLAGMLSVETQGMGSGEWTPEQIAALKELIVWAATEHGFPVALATSPTSGGIGYHCQFAAWNPNGHSCPGPDRVRQFRAVLVPWFPVALAPAAPPHKSKVDKFRDRLTALVKAAKPGSRRREQLTKARNALPGGKNRKG
jgi:hypothetical protein